MKKIISLMMIIAMCFAMLLVTNNTVIADETDEGMLFLAFWNEQPYVGDLDTTYENPICYFKENATDIRYAVPNDALTYIISDTSVAKFENNTIVPLKYGSFTLKATYEYNGKTYTSQEQKIIVCPFLFRQSGEYGILNKYEVNLNNDQKTDELSLKIIGAYSREGIYPEGYTKKTYHDIEWSIEDDTIATIEEVRDSSVDSKIKITGLKSGSTYIYCSDTNPIGDGAAQRTRILLTVDISEENNEEVNNENEGEKENTENKENKDNKENTENKEFNKESKDDNTENKDNTVATKKLSQTGEKVTLLIALGVFVLVACITKIKSKK